MNSTIFSSFVKEALALQTEDANTPPGYLSTKTAVVRKMEMSKVGSLGRHLMELGGLGVLAKPSFDEARGKHVDEKKKAKREVQGLSMLAAPYAHDIAKTHVKPYSRAIGRIGSSRVGKALSFLGSPVGH